jgi:ubiquinone/menaquinone biosynthesis C-methylase UbiE
MNSINYEYLKNFWNSKNTPLHFHKTDFWFELYFKEIELLFNSVSDELLDIGCGSGELLPFMAEKYKIIYGVDYSQSMLTKAQEVCEKRNLINKVHLHNLSALEVDEFFKNKLFKHILLSGVIQYLNLSEIEALFKKLKSILTPDGAIVLTNIPDYNLKICHDIGIFHWSRNIRITPKKFLYFYLRNIYHKLRNYKQSKEKERTMGYWYTRNELEMIAQKTGYSTICFNSLYEPYGYKFHLKLTHK